MPTRTPRPPRPDDLVTNRDVLQAWAEGRVGWQEILWWGVSESLDAIPALARAEGVAWAPPPARPDYDSNLVNWSEHQSNLLLRLAAGDPYAANQIDWANLADEVADVGMNLVHEGEAYLTRALVYVAKLAAAPENAAAGVWRKAASNYLLTGKIWLRRPAEARHACLESAWREARRIALCDLGLPDRHSFWPDSLPFSIDDLLKQGSDPVELAKRIRKAAAAGTDQDPD